MKILIAEDDVMTREMLVSLLQKFEHDVVACEDGTQAWEALQKEGAPRLVILDWLMPGIDGTDLTRRLRLQSSPQPYVIMLTVKSRLSEKIEGFDSGVDDYVIKPIDPMELQARIRVGERILKMQETLDDQVSELKKALAEIHTLQGILPICSYCKKIRDDGGEWEQLEKYIHSRSAADFSHSICPDCMKREFPDIKIS
jgi:DNA-binding response OmpR family regulator